MNETVANVLEKLRKDNEYPALFKEVFGTDAIETSHFFKALSQFQLMCISAESPYDKYVLGEGTLSDEALHGKAIFDSKCSKCHEGVLQTDQTIRNNGLSVRNPTDKGRALITEKEEGVSKFRVPSLRNWKYTSPFMHDGRFKSLDEVFELYNSGILKSSTLDTSLTNGIPLTAQERTQLKAFMETLNDENFIRNPLTEVF